MSRIQINPDQLEAFADQIGRAEQECDHALNAINWHLGSLAANFPGTLPASIENLEADFTYQIKKYKHKLDDVQRLVKLTASSTRQSEQSLAGKVGGFLLEMVGWYDIQRLAGEYDPVTGEKLSAGDKALAGLMLALTIFPPAKAVGVGGKAVSMGVKAGKGAAAKTGFAAIAKTPEVFKGIRNVVSTQKVQKAFKQVYNDVVVAPFSATRQWIANTAKAMGDIRIPSLGHVPATAGGPAFNQTTVREAFSGAKESIVKMAVETEDRWKGFVGKGTVRDKQIFTKGFDVEPKYSSYDQRVKTTPVNKGEWSSNRAESLFISDKTGEIKKYLDEAGVDGVEYKNGMPDFSPFSKGEIKLQNMTNDRKSNFSTADEELAKKWSTTEQKWTADDIADWREDNKYTWHELNDLETIQLVPSKINSVFKHLGGVGEYNLKVKLGE